MAIITGRSGTFNISTANQYISGYVKWVETYDSDTYAETYLSTITMTAYLHRTNTYNQDTYASTEFYRTMVIGGNVLGDTSTLMIMEQEFVYI